MSFNEKAYKFSIRDDTSFVVENDVPVVVSETSGIYEEPIESIAGLPSGGIGIPLDDAEIIMFVQYDRLKNAVDNGIPCGLVTTPVGSIVKAFHEFIRIDDEGILYFGHDGVDEPNLTYMVHPNGSVEAVANEEEIGGGDAPGPV